MSLQDLRIFQEASAIADDSAVIVSEWSHFDQHVLGSQLCQSADAIASYIGEGYGRTATSEKLQLMFSAEGSLQRTKTQFRLAYGRKLITEEVHDHYQSRLRRLSISIVEFCAAILDRDPEYNGGYKEMVQRRRAWLIKKQVERTS